MVISQLYANKYDNYNVLYSDKLLAIFNLLKKNPFHLNNKGENIWQSSYIKYPVKVLTHQVKSKNVIAYLIS